MERYTLTQLYDDIGDFTDNLKSYVSTFGTMGLTVTQTAEVVGFIGNAIFGYFYDDLVAYLGDDESDVVSKFEPRIFYDIAVKLPYWYRKYTYIKTLLTDSQLSLFQTSKMISSSSDTTKSAGGTLQKTATTPTGVSTGSTATDAINIDIKSGTSDGENDIETEGFVDKYTNAQQKFANASRVEGSREGEILREGSIEELVDVLERLPSSFADEVTRAMQKHFIFEYDGLDDYYDEN